MAVIVEVVINTQDAEQQLNAFQTQAAESIAASVSSIGQGAGQAATRAVTQAGQATAGQAKMTGAKAAAEFLRGFDPDKLRASLEGAGLGEQEIDIILNTAQAKAETQGLKDSIASALSEASGLAEDTLTSLSAQVAREVDRAAGKVKSVTEIVDGVRDVKEELKDLGAAGGEAAEGIGMLVLDATVDKFGDVKDIFEKTGQSLLGLSEQTVEYGVLIGDIAEKGASIGAVFGPVGAAAGLVGGAILGAFTVAADAEKKFQEQLKEQQTRLAETEQYVIDLKEAYQDLGDIDFSRFLSDLDEIQKKQDELKKGAPETKDQIQLYVKEVLALDEAKNAALAAGADKLAEMTLKSLTDINLALNKDTEPKSLTRLQEDAADARYELEQTQKKLGDFYKNLKPPAELESYFPKFAAVYSKALLLAAGKDYTKLAKEAETGAQKLTEAENALASATKGSASAMSSKNDEIERGLRNTKGQLTAFGELEKLESQHAKNIKARTDLEKLGADLLADLDKDLQESRKKTAALDDKLAKDQEARDKLALERKKQMLDIERDLTETNNKISLAAAAEQAAAIKEMGDEMLQYVSPLTDVFGAVFDELVKGIEEGNVALADMGKAALEALKGVLLGIAKESAIKALQMTAYGIAASVLTPGAGAAYFKSAATHAAVAALAGAAGLGAAAAQGAASGAGGGGSGGGGGGGGGARSESDLGRGAAAAGNGASASVVVDLRGAVFPTADLTQAQALGEALSKSIAAAAAGGQPSARRLVGRGFIS